MRIIRPIRSYLPPEAKSDYSNLRNNPRLSRREQEFRRYLCSPEILEKYGIDKPTALLLRKYQRYDLGNKVETQSTSYEDTKEMVIQFVAKAWKDLSMMRYGHSELVSVHPDNSQHVYMFDLLENKLRILLDGSIMYEQKALLSTIIHEAKHQEQAYHVVQSGLADDIQLGPDKLMIDQSKYITNKLEKYGKNIEYAKQLKENFEDYFVPRLGTKQRGIVDNYPIIGELLEKYTKAPTPELEQQIERLKDLPEQMEQNWKEKNGCDKPYAQLSPIEQEDVDYMAWKSNYEKDVIDKYITDVKKYLNQLVEKEAYDIKYKAERYYDDLPNLVKEFKTKKRGLINQDKGLTLTPSPRSDGNV